VPSSRGSRRQGAIKRRIGVKRARESARVELRGVDARIARLRERARAGEDLSEAQRSLLDSYGGAYPPTFD
jgi:hypothetical protein